MGIGRTIPAQPSPTRALPGTCPQRRPRRVQVRAGRTVVRQLAQHRSHPTRIRNRREHQPRRYPGGQQTERPVRHRAQRKTGKNRRPRRKPNLPLHRPRTTAVRLAQGMPLRDPGRRTTGKVHRRDAVLRKEVAGLRRTVTGGADDEKRAARRRFPQIGEGLGKVVQGNVQGARNVTAGVLTGSPDIDDGEIPETGIRLAGVEDSGRGFGDAHGGCDP